MAQRVFIGLLAISGAILLCIVAVKMYELAVARRSPAAVEEPRPPSAPGGEVAPKVSRSPEAPAQVDLAGEVADAQAGLPPVLPPQTSTKLAGRFPAVEMPGDILDVALDTQVGRLAVAGPFGKSLGIYETSEFPGRPQFVALDGPVTSVATKPLDAQRLFVAGIDAPPRLVLIDTETLAVTGTVKLDTSAPRQLVANQDPEDPHVVYLTGPDLKGPRVFDLRQLSEVDTMGAGIVDAVFSSDGRTRFFRSSSRKRGVGLFAERRIDGPEAAPGFDFEPIGNKLGSGLPMYPSPSGWFIAVGNELLSTDLREKFATVAFEPQAFFGKKPWMAGLRKKQFCVGSMNDYRTVVRIDLPANWLDSPADAKPIGYRPRELRWRTAVATRVFADDKNEQFLLATPRHLVSFPLAMLDLPAEQVLWSTSDFPEVVTIGEPLAIELQYAGKPDRVSLSKHPPEMALNEMLLQWTPQEDDFGNHEIEIVTSSGDAVKSETHTFHVQRPYVEPPFSVSGGIEISDDGRRAVVWGARVDGTAEPYEFKQLCVIDLHSRRIIATKDVDKPFTAAILLADDVYILRRGQLERLSSETLEPRHVESLIPPRSRTLTVFGEGHRPWRFDLVTLNRLEDEQYDSDFESSEDWLAGPTAFGWVSEGILWNEITGQPKLLLWPYAFRRTPWQHALRSSPRSAGEINLTTNTWHPCSHNSARPRSSSSLRNKVVFTTVSADLPAFLAITQDDEAFHLAALSLIGRWEIQKIPLVRKVEESSPGDGFVGIETKGEAYVVLFQGKLHFGSLRSLLQSVEAPLHVAPQQDAVTLLADRLAKVRYQAAGAAQFHLESRDLALDGGWFHAESASGEFTLSVAESLDRLIDSHAELIANLPAVRTASNKERLDHYLRPARWAFLSMLGRPPDGVPVPVRVIVTAEGADSGKASIAHDFLVDVSRQQFEAALDRRYPLGRDPWREPEEDVFDPATDAYPDELSPPSGSNRLFAYMRREWAAVRQPADSLKEAAQAAKIAGDERLRTQYLNHVSQNRYRAWTDKDGNKIEASLVNQFAGHVVLKTRGNTELVLDEDHLSEDDRRYLADYENPAAPSETDMWRTFILRHTVRAVNSFHGTEGVLPPQALVDDSARPLLSWRVLLLRQLGYEELYSLFRLDEPWNSEHNRVLIEFMPKCFAFDAQQAQQNYTAMLTVVSPRSTLRTDQAVSLSGITDGAASTVVLVEAVPARAVPWTQPVDLALYQLADPSEALRSRSGAVSVGVLDGTVLTVPASSPRETWRYAIEDGDGKPLERP